MNSFFELLSMKLAYDRGKETGLAGIVGIIVVLACIALWGYIRPILEFFGVIDMLESLGLIHPEEAGITWLRLVGGFLAFYVIAIIIFFTLLFLVMIFSALISSKFGDWLLRMFAYIMFFVVVSPFFVLISPLVLLLGIIEGVSFLKNPTKYKEEYKEKKRVNKKKLELQLTSELGINKQSKLNPNYDRAKEYVAQARADLRGETYIPTPKENPNYRENNEITFKEAFHRLNRLPMLGDYLFLIAVTYDRTFYILLPLPLNLGYPRKEVFQALEVDVNHKVAKREKGQKLTDGKFRLVVPEADSKLKTLDYLEIEHYFDIGDAPVYVNQFRNIHSKELYKNYIEKVQYEYFNKKENMVNTLMDPNQKSVYEQYLKEYNELLVSNDEMVSLVRYSRKKVGTTQW